MSGDISGSLTRKVSPIYHLHDIIWTIFAATEERQKKAAAGEEEDEDEDDPAARFIMRLLRFLHKGCMAKDKIVRYRVVQCISEMIAHLGELEYVFTMVFAFHPSRSKSIIVKMHIQP